MFIPINHVRALSHRETQIARLMRMGYSNKVIAHELAITIGSVSSYIRRIRRKLQKKSRRDVIVTMAEVDGMHDQLSAMSPPGRVTHAEKAILRAVVLGQTNVEIAINRGRSPRTVASQVSALMRKIGVRSRAELFARFAIDTQPWTAERSTARALSAEASSFNKNGGRAGA
jgi:DNA-binding NarL/FixJ family response regulator